MILNGCFQACAKSLKATSQNVLIIFCMWLDKHKYIYLIQSIHMSVLMYT